VNKLWLKGRGRCLFTKYNRILIIRRTHVKLQKQMKFAKWSVPTLNSIKFLQSNLLTKQGEKRLTWERTMKIIKWKKSCKSKFKTLTKVDKQQSGRKISSKIDWQWWEMLRLPWSNKDKLTENITKMISKVVNLKAKCLMMCFL